MSTAWVGGVQAPRRNSPSSTNLSNRPQEMIGRNVLLKRELIKQSCLFDLPMSHHDLQSCLSQRLNQRTSSGATDDFFNMG